MASRRGQLDPFGASLLDMMCCGLGAAIIVFVLRQMTVNQSILAADASTQAAMTVATRAERDAAAAQQQSRRDARRIRDARQVSMFGLPPLGGNVCILIDCSGSMQGDSKLQVAKDCIASVLRDNTAIGWLRLSSFTECETVIFQEELPEAGTQKRAERLQAAIAAASGLNANGGTNVPAVLTTAIATTETRGDGTIVLFTDGISQGESADVLQKVKAAGGTGRLTVHCVGLFQRPEVASITIIDGRYPGQLLREVANAGRGVFVGVPVPLVKAP